MKRLLNVVALMLCVSWMGTVAAQPISERGADKHVLPVLVAVDANGNVTKIDSAIELRPAQEQVLERAVRQMITGPATDKKGHGVDSQMVLRFSMQPVEGSAAAYAFAYLGAESVQSGSLHWVNTEHGFALAPARSERARKNRQSWQKNTHEDLNIPPKQMVRIYPHTPENYPHPSDNP